MLQGEEFQVGGMRRCGGKRGLQSGETWFHKRLCRRTCIDKHERKQLASVEPELKMPISFLLEKEKHETILDVHLDAKIVDIWRVGLLVLCGGVFWTEGGDGWDVCLESI